MQLPVKKLFFFSLLFPQISDQNYLLTSFPYSDANREVVLNHVKGHYQEAGIKFEDKNVPVAELSQQIISQPNPSPPITAVSPIPTTSSSSPNKLYLSKVSTVNLRYFCLSKTKQKKFFFSIF